MTEKRQLDVLVIGAGPAGSVAAMRLAQAGMRVVLCDRAVFPRDKTCGDGLIADALAVLKTLGLEQPAHETAAFWRPVPHLSKVEGIEPAFERSRAITIYHPVSRLARTRLARKGSEARPQEWKPHDGEALRLQQGAGRLPELGVVIDDEHGRPHAAIVSESASAAHCGQPQSIHPRSPVAAAMCRAHAPLSVAAMLNNGGSA